MRTKVNCMNMDSNEHLEFVASVCCSASEQAHSRTHQTYSVHIFITGASSWKVCLYSHQRSTQHSSQHHLFPMKIISMGWIHLFTVFAKYEQTACGETKTNQTNGTWKRNIAENGKLSLKHTRRVWCAMMCCGMVWYGIPFRIINKRLFTFR